MANINFKLEIDGPTPVSYGSDVLTVDTVEIEERTNGLFTERSSVRVEVTELFSWASPDDIPPNQTYRCRLIREFDTVFDGVLDTQDITYTPERDAWDLLLTTDEIERLEDTEVSFRRAVAIENQGDPYEGPEAYKVPVVVTGNTEGYRVNIERLTTFAAGKLLEFCLDELVTEGTVASYDLPPDPAPTETVDVWIDGTEQEVVTGLTATPINDDCYDTIVALAELFGYRLTASYATYPSEAINLNFRALDNPPSAGALPTKRNARDIIETDNVEAGLRLSGAEQNSTIPEATPLDTLDYKTYFPSAHIPAEKGLGLTKWDVAPPNGAFDDPFLRILPREVKIETTTIEYARAPVSVIYHAVTNEVDPFSDPSLTDEERVDTLLPYGPAMVEDTPTEVTGTFNMLAPGLIFDVIFIESAAGVPSGVRGVPRAADTVYCIHAREDTNTNTVTSPTFIDLPYENTVELRGFRKRLETGVQGRLGLQKVGEWAPERVRYDVDTGYTRLDATSLVTEPRDAPAYIQDEFSVSNIRGRFVESSNAEDFIQLWWDRPPLRFDKAYYYQVEMKSQATDGPAITEPSTFVKGVWYWAQQPQAPYAGDIGSSIPPLREKGRPLFFWHRHYASALSISNPFDTTFSEWAVIADVAVRITPYTMTGLAGDPVREDLGIIFGATERGI